tara:strand:+ start:533 stop:1189 length:657 start_codon:yes stop_codon:yes gene_type:complete
MAVYCSEIGLLYICTPRTGSNSIRCFLKENYNGVDVGKYHGSLGASLDIIGTKEVLKITTIRNQFDSLFSKYCKADMILKDAKKATNPKAWESVIEICNSIIGGTSFSDLFKKYPNFSAMRWMTPVENVKTMQGSTYFSEFDDLIYFSNIQKDVDRILKKLGVDNEIKVPTHNVTANRNKADYKNQYTEEARNVVIKMFRYYLIKEGFQFKGIWKMML